MRRALNAISRHPLLWCVASEEDEEVRLPQKELIIYGFDEAAKGPAGGTISRQGALKLAGSALLGGGLLTLFPGVAGAQVSVERGCAGMLAINDRQRPEEFSDRLQ